MQPTSGQIDSGDETTPAPTAAPGRTTHLRTIQPLHNGLDKQKSGIDSLMASANAEAQAKQATAQPLSAHSETHPAEAGKPMTLHDSAAPHPVAPRQSLPPPEPVVDPLHQSVPGPEPAPVQRPIPKPPVAAAPQVARAIQAQPIPQPPKLSAEPQPPRVELSNQAPSTPHAPIQTNTATNPLPKPVTSSQPGSVPQHPQSGQQAHPQTADTPMQQAAPAQQKPAAQSTQATQAVQATSSNQSNQPKPSAQPSPQPAPAKKPAVQPFIIDKNEALMRSSNPLGATLSGIELLINRNGIVSIGYVSIFLSIIGPILGVLYIAGRFLNVEFLSINFSMIALIAVSILLIATYMCSFVVCVASEAGQSLSLRQIFYLTRKNLFKLLALQILTIVATFFGLLLGIVPGVIVLGRWMMAPFMIFESDHPSIMTAIKRSNKLTKGRTVEMTGLVFAQVLLLSTGLLGFAAMAAGPAARYQQLRMRIHDKTAVTKVHFLNYIMSVLLAFSLLGGMAGGGYQIYRTNQTVCYSSVRFVSGSGRPSPTNVCVKRHVCQRDIVCRETLKENDS